ncbi:MAG: 5-dehydro-2-deoxygluconokinase [Rhodobacteraceae bacterium]|nr:5-dehydro-2-deoxygluconokinase [Paracoccaceae bacterium]
MKDQHLISPGKFAVLGRAGMDLYADPVGTRIETARTYEAHLGGSAGNIAAALARLGAEAALITCVSDDAVGRFVLAELDRYGIDRTHVALVGNGRRTSLAVVETRPEDCQAIIYRNGAADFSLSKNDVENIDFNQFSTLAVTGTALAEAGSRAAAMAALRAARMSGCFCLLDVDYRPYSWVSTDEAQAACAGAAALCDGVIGNELEFDILAGRKGDGRAFAQQIVTNGARFAIYKMGENGAITYCPDCSFRTSIYQTKALKPTGAGDAFLGALLAALAKGSNLQTAVLRGSAAAAIVVSRIGCAPASPTNAEIDALMRHAPQPAIDRGSDAHSTL